jgi:hypothetical protein
MFWGGYNRGRSAAAGITNMYASDAVMCPSGQRRQPKFGHFEALHRSLITSAPILLYSSTALLKNRSVEVLSEEGSWKIGRYQQMFVYATYNVHGGEQSALREAIFVENNANASSVVRVPVRNGTDQQIYELEAFSAVLFINGMLMFDSAAIKPASGEYVRRVLSSKVDLLDCSLWREPIGVSQYDMFVRSDAKPIEQTSLNVQASVLSDYAWYESEFTLDRDLSSSTLLIETAQANAFLVYVDGKLFGAADSHKHKEGRVLLNVTMGSILRGNHILALLSESLGYGNLVGRWGGVSPSAKNKSNICKNLLTSSFFQQGTRAKVKGIAGAVILASPQLDIDFNLVDGRTWRSYAGLHGERFGAGRQNLKGNLLPEGSNAQGGIWSSTLFDTPGYDSSTQGLFVDILFGRGRLWLNGQDLGRFWNITQGDTEERTQRYYFLPPDFLYTNGSLNELVFFDAFGGSCLSNAPSIALSWIEHSDSKKFPDDVGFQSACI